MANICCPFDSTSTTGGVVCGGAAYVDLVSDPYDGLICILPLDEESDGSVGEFVDRSRNHFDGRGGKVLLSGEDPDPGTYPTLDSGLFCLPSQHFAGRQTISIEQDNLTSDHDFTVSLWTKFKTYAKSRTFYSRGYNDGAGNKYVVSFGHSFLNTLSVSVNTTVDGAPVEILTFGGTTLTVGQWYHVALTFSNSTLTMYVNGVSVGSEVLAGDLIALGNGCMLASTDFASNLEGNLQEFRLYGEAKSANYLLSERDSFCDYFVNEGSEEPLLYW